MRGKWFYSVLLIVAALLAACAPADTPAPAAAPPVAPAPSALAARGPSSDDANWAQVLTAAKKEGKIIVYMYSWVGDIGLDIGRAFEKRYGIRVDMISGRGAEFIERLKTENRMGQVMADVMQGSPIHLSNMRNEGLMLSVTEDLPAVREKGVWLVEPLAIDPKDKIVLVPYQMEYTIHINTRLVKAGDEPKLWRDLLAPRWKGKMSLIEPNVSAGTYLLFVPLLDKKVIDEEWVKALYGQDLQFPISSIEEAKSLARGDVALQIRGSGASSAPVIAEGAPVKAVDMREGLVMSVGALSFIKGAPHPNAGRVFLNWLFTREGQEVWGKAQSIWMGRKDVPDFRPEPLRINPTNPIILTPEYETRATQMFREKWFDRVAGRKGR